MTLVLLTSDEEGPGAAGAISSIESPAILGAAFGMAVKPGPILLGLACATAFFNLKEAGIMDVTDLSCK